MAEKCSQSQIKLNENAHITPTWFSFISEATAVDLLFSLFLALLAIFLTSLVMASKSSCVSVEELKLLNGIVEIGQYGPDAVLLKLCK